MWKKLCNKNGWIQFFRFVAISRLQTAWWCPSKTVELSFSSLNPALRKKNTTVTTKSVSELCLETEKWPFEEPTIGIHACKPVFVSQNCPKLLFLAFRKNLGFDLLDHGISSSVEFFSGVQPQFSFHPWRQDRPRIFGTRSCVCRNGHNRTYFSHTGFTLLPRRVFTVAGIHVCNRFQQLPATCVPMTQFLDFLCCVVLCRAMSVVWHQTCVLLFRAMSVA